MIAPLLPLRRMSLHGKSLTVSLALIALLLSAAPAVFAQSAPVDGQSLKFHVDPEKSEVSVDFRLVEDTVASDPAPVSVRATATGVPEPLRTAWKPWADAEVPATAWLIIIDSSNPGRQATVADNAKLIQAFIRKLPGRDAFAIQELALGLKEVAPFGTPAGTAAEKLALVKAEGDASLGTLIHQSVREGLKLLEERSEPRKAVLLLSDGKDETPGGVTAITQAQNQLIAAANENKVVIHTIGYSERADELVHFGQLRELSNRTGGIHVPAALRTRALPDGAMERFLQVMQGAGRAVVNVGSLKDVSPQPEVLLEVATESGRRTRITIPAEQVTAALTPATPPPTDPVEDPDGPTTGEETDVTGGENGGAGGEGDGTDPTTVPIVEDDEIVPPTDKESGISPWIWVILGLLVVIGVVAALKIRAQSRRREEEAIAAEEAARLAAERDEDERKRAIHAEQTRKSEATKPLAWLEMCDDKQSKTPVTISSLKIGRGRHNDLVIRNDSVSGNHCVINLTREGVWTISDLQSGNGTMVNEQRINQANLQHGDIIELGEMRMRFLIPS